MKKYLLGCMAILVAVGLSAYTKVTKEAKPATQQYFKYMDYPDDTYIGVASHYEPSSDLGCTTGAHRCAVIAEPDASNSNIPNLSDPLIQLKAKD